jgi:hypothetical protein
MALPVSLDPFHCFRFAPRVGYDGKPHGVSMVDVQPGDPWTGPGKVVIEAALKPEIIDLAKVRNPVPLIVGVYHITDELGENGEASLNIVLSEVVPAKAQLVITPLDAMSSDVLKVTFTMSYDRLTFLFGKADEVSLLDKMAAVV